MTASPITQTRRLGAATIIVTSDTYAHNDLSIALPGRQPVSLRPTEEQLGEAIDMLIAMRRRMRDAKGERP